MKITNRLRLSYILMLLVPVILIMVTGAILQDHYESGVYSVSFPESFLSEAYSVMSGQPEKLLSADYLNELGSLGGRDGIVLKVYYAGGQISSTESGRHGSGMFASSWDFYFSDGSTGRLTVSIHDRGKMMGAYPQRGLLFLLVVGVLVLTNGVLSYIVAGSIIRPLNILKDAAVRIKNEDLDLPIEYQGRDEFKDVYASFEEMRVRLRDSLHDQLMAEENRKELLSSISHDLKTPITTIKGYVEGIRDGIADTPEKIEKYIDTVYRKSVLMNELIDSLFLFSKLDLNRVQFNFRTLDLGIFLRDICEELSFDHPELEIALETVLKPVMVAADSIHLHRLVANLVDNAVKYRGESEPRVQVSIEREADKAVVSIKDNGRGIAEDAVPHIFEHFYRSDPARSSKVDGSGLGLAIAKQIITAHGGSIKAESRSGEGTVMTFTLRLAG